MICLMSAGLGHAGHAAFGADHGGNALESHDGSGAGLFGDARLLDVHDVHDDAALEHLGQADFETQAGGTKVTVLDAVLGVVCHVDVLWRRGLRDSATGAGGAAANLQFSSFGRGCRSLSG